MKLSKKITAMLMIGLISAFVAGCGEAAPNASQPQQNTSAAQASTVDESSSASQKRAIEDKDIVGVWINHIDTDINQKITFKADHTWTENQHNVDNIYSGTWSISGDHSIYLEPYGETIEINPDNLKEMNVVRYHHRLTKEDS
ncbi:hypothetical protein [Megasphaera sp. DISK 18]|uniref:hypothetical protein n=1 Tax=Megasphaera sp. DISK 18 TaxID=1776081 RepID=UPI0008080FA2|nr:hypothetical protein [Megasphaera sp. DISK 18]OBZ32862.1 hypothetical protein A0U42_09095 [Megasphaera sp. DISK 18]